MLKQSEDMTVSLSPMKSEVPVVQDMFLSKYKPDPVLVLTKLLTSEGVVCVKHVRNAKAVIQIAQTNGTFGIAIRHADKVREWMAAHTVYLLLKG
jgi:hypothetical protein